MKTREKREIKCRKNEGNIKKRSARKSVFFDVVERFVEEMLDYSLKHLQNSDKSLIYKVLYSDCDTCDSKNTKTPVMYAYARTRENR